MRTRGFPSRVPVFILQLLVLVCGSSLLGAQQPSWTLAGPAFSASVEDLQAAAAKVTAEKFMDGTVLFERDAYTLDATGRVTYRHSMIYRVETKDGIERWSETSVRWEPWYQNEPQVHARVIAPDGKVSQLDQKTVTDGPAKEDDEDTYTDARIRKAPLPGIVVGAIIEEETETQDKMPFFSGGSIYRDEFSRDVPIIRCELVLDIPKEMKVQYRTHLLPAIKITDQEQGDRRHLEFVQADLPASQDSDINLATHNFAAPMVEFSTGESWGTVAAEYRKLAEPQIDPDKVKALLPAQSGTIQSGTNRMETIQQIVSRLHKEVRYTGIEFGQASLQPQPAAEVLKRHFGDCKDKAAMLVSMLRAAGIPANLALLDTGPGQDVTPELPGMNQFDHAIVYVPGDGKGSEPLWIDATAEYAQVGVLPVMDQGRLALVIADGTRDLTSTPTLKPEDDKLIELRDVVMSAYGPAHIEETSLTHGPVDDSYRSDFGGPETRENKTNLENYAKDQYLAKTLTRVEHSDGKDFSKPFVLKLEMAEAKRGNTTIDDAEVAIPFSGIFGRLPAWFTTDPRNEGEKLTEQQEDDHKRAVLARTSEYDVHPFTTEWHYTITPPDGFVLRAIHEDKTMPMGPGKFTQHYETDSKGVIHAVFHFDTGKTRYSLEEVLALRDAVLATYKQDMIMVMFDQVGAKLVEAGKIRDGLAADRALIERHPTEALHHAQMAYALLKAGMGDRARKEAQEATRLDPKSGVAFKALGWMCEFNAIGIQYGHGYDPECSVTAFKKAMELDADDTNSALNLASIYEFDADGERYSADAHLSDAVREYKAIQEKDKSAADEYEDNLLFDLLYAHQYKELLERLDKVTSSVTRDALGISAVVAMQGSAKGVAAGIDRSDHLPAGAKERNSALATAGNQLLHLRMYPEAADILAASAEGQSDSAAVAQQIGIFRHMTPWSGQFMPAGDPRSVVQRMFISVMMGKYSDKLAAEVLSRHAYGSEEEWRRNDEKVRETTGMLHNIAGRAGTPANVLLDVIAGNLKFTAEGDDQTGYKVSVQSLGSKAQQFFVSKDDEAYKVVTDGTTPSEAGNEALYLLHSGREAGAKFLLDWMRDRMHRGGGDDPLSGPLLPRFWTLGETTGTPAMELAAASLLADNEAIKPLLPEIRAEWEKATADDLRLDLGMLLARGYFTAEDGPSMKAVSVEILAKYPNSYVAIDLAGKADSLLKDWNDWNTMLDGRIAKHPEDENLLRMKVEAARAQGDFVLARATTQKIIDLGKATAAEYNDYAWMGLFDGKVDADSAKNAQQAVMLTQSTSFGELHTMAAIYAFQGKTAEARDMLLKAMTAANLGEPNSEVWYVLGSIYEQYGVNDAAVAAYRKVEKPEGRVNPESTYLLAQARLKALGAQKL